MRWLKEEIKIREKLSTKYTHLSIFMLQVTERVFILKLVQHIYQHTWKHKEGKIK